MILSNIVSAFSLAAVMLSGALVAAQSNVNTTGLNVIAPYNNMKLYQDGYMNVQFSLAGNVFIANAVVTMATASGDKNTTVFRAGAARSVIYAYKVPGATFSPGDYTVNMIVTPAPTNGTASTTAAVPPTSTSSNATGAATPTTTSITLPSVMYYSATVTVVGPDPAAKSAAVGALGRFSWTKMMATSGVLAMVLAGAVL